MMNDPKMKAAMASDPKMMADCAAMHANMDATTNTAHAHTTVAPPKG